MAFTVTEDHARQEQVWEAVQQGYNNEAYYIRRASDRRRRQRRRPARASSSASRPTRPPAAPSPATCSRTTAAAGSRTRRCSTGSPTEKLKAEAEKLAAEGWKWIAAAIDFPYGHKQGLRRLDGETVEMTRGGRSRPRRAQPRNTIARGGIRGCRRTARRGRSAPRRTRGDDRGARRPPGPLRSRRHRPRGRFHQPRSRRRPLHRARLCPARGRGAGARRTDGTAEAQTRTADAARARPSHHRHHRRRRAGRSRGRRGGATAASGRFRTGWSRSSPPSARSRSRDAVGERAGRRLPLGASCALPCRLLPLLRQRKLHGDQREERELRFAGAIAQGQRLGQGDRGAPRRLAGAPAGEAGRAVGCAHRARQRQPGRRCSRTAPRSRST